MIRYIARFTPQAWVNNNAIEVDPQGDQEWEATERFNALDEAYRTSLLDEINSVEGEALDRHDALRHDPHAPEWIRLWRGPFEIHVRAAYDLDWFVMELSMLVDALQDNQEEQAQKAYPYLTTALAILSS